MPFTNVLTPARPFACRFAVATRATIAALGQIVATGHRRHCGVCALQIARLPAALFAAVAQVLAYVYQLRAAMSGQVAMPAALPELDVPAELDPHHTPVPDMEDFE